MGPASGTAGRSNAAGRSRGSENRSHTVVQTQQMAAASGRKQFAASEPSVSHAETGRKDTKRHTEEGGSFDRRVRERTADTRARHQTVATKRKGIRTGRAAVGKITERRQSEALRRLHDPIHLLYAASVEEL